MWDFIEKNSMKEKMNPSTLNQTTPHKFASAIACMLLLLAGSQLLSPAHAAASTVTASVQPDSHLGYLEVFSSTEPYQAGEGVFYYPHSGYRLYDASGKSLRWIGNNSGSIDENPEKVELAPGVYTIWAQSDHGYQTLKIVVKPARITSVQLEETKDGASGINQVSVK